MFIKEVVIDGFKSYARKTEINGFDPHFNAITGLNGSGKSNILDAICFVLGITNLSQVRAGNLSELVYKQGQAGVNKAVVSIVFSNDDPSCSPVGYEQCSTITVTRQVLIGGKSKYLINGRNSPAGQVQNLFHTVQLNVNNPHFLIMQGRITKVLNMKAPEILGMVEEAAGTRMYETKRQAAMKTIEKKQNKLEDLNTILSDEITPTLERLRGEKQSYLQWSKNSADIERLERFVVAGKFVKATKALDATSSVDLKSNLEKVSEKVHALKSSVASLSEEVDKCQTAMSGELKDSNSLLQKKEKECSNNLVQKTSAWESAKAVVLSAEGDLQVAERLCHEAELVHKAKASQLEDLKRSKTELSEQKEVCEKNVAKLVDDCRKMQAGISDDSASLPEQITRAHCDSKGAEAKMVQAETKCKHLRSELKTLERQLKSEKAAASTLLQNQENSKQKVDEIRGKLEEIEFRPEEYAEKERQRSSLELEVAELSENLESLKTKLEARLSFNFKDPVKGFDTSKIKGIVANLVSVKDSRDSVALEVVAGGRLYHVVVDEHITGKALLERGKLQRRVTIIPLDKIKSRSVASSVVDRAQDIASQFNVKAVPAIDLVGFDEEVRNAMEYVFGSSIVVDNGHAADEICSTTKTRTVTLEGDVYDPTGTISGGSRNQLGTTLSSLGKVVDMGSSLKELREDLILAKDYLKRISKVAAIYESLHAELEVATAEHDGASKQISQTRFGVLNDQIDSVTKDIAIAEQTKVAMKEEKDKKWQLFCHLKDKEDDLTAERESRLSVFQNDVDTAKESFTQICQAYDKVSADEHTVASEFEHLHSELSALKDGCLVAQASLDEAIQARSHSEGLVEKAQVAYEDARSKLEESEQKRSAVSAEVVELKRKRADVHRQLDSMVLDEKKLSIAISQSAKDKANQSKVIAAMLKAHPWIAEEKDAFGRIGGDYDFEKCNVEETAQQLVDLKAEQTTLEQRINKKVMGMIEKAEGEYVELLRKRKVVENDKAKITKVIHELDEKKKSELHRTWEKVNKDFGSIFSTLLPGASAKLEPPDGMEAWEGLEVKVAFGDVWKESLSELSGGQRSLLALSLILSLLLFKPAPMYILDEVDAALDLSHTQNIGNMLKTHFSQSQFIVVSLKEGMFNNANVIFRTKFVDGVSTVSRSMGSRTSHPHKQQESLKLPSGTVRHRQDKENRR